MVQQTRSPGEPEAGPACDADHGATCHLPAGPDQPADTREQGVSLLTGRHEDHQTQPGVGGRHHLHPHGQGVLILSGHHGLVQPARGRVATSNTLDADFCVEALREALSNGTPEVFNTDQGSQFSSEGFIGLLEQHGVRISMDGKGRYSDNIFIERLWRTVKYEEVYLKAYSGGREAKHSLDNYFWFYDTQRPHQASDYMTPAEVFNLAPTQSHGQPPESSRTHVKELVNCGTAMGSSFGQESALAI